MGNGAYCSPADITQITHTTIDKEVTEAEIYDWIEKSMFDIDSCLAGIYEVPFATRTDPIEWDTADEIPPMIRKWCQKLTGAYLIRKLFTAKAGKNISPYSDRLKRESNAYCEAFRDGELNLLDINGNIIPRLDAGTTDAVTGYSEMYPDPAEHVMPDMYEEYPDAGLGGDNSGS